MIIDGKKIAEELRVELKKKNNKTEKSKEVVPAFILDISQDLRGRRLRRPRFRSSDTPEFLFRGKIPSKCFFEVAATHIDPSRCHFGSRFKPLGRSPSNAKSPTGLRPCVASAWDRPSWTRPQTPRWHAVPLPAGSLGVFRTALVTPCCLCCLLVAPFLSGFAIMLAAVPTGPAPFAGNFHFPTLLRVSR